MKKRVWVLTGIILLLAGILFEQRPRVETLGRQVYPALLPAPVDELFAVHEINFHQYVDLWGKPWVKLEDPGFGISSLPLASSAKPADPGKLQPQVHDKTGSVITMHDRQLEYNVLNVGGLRLNLNFRPEYATPEALLPNRIDPGISGSFSF